MHTHNDADLMHSYDSESIAWFHEDVIRGPNLILHDNGDLGDTVKEL